MKTIWIARDEFGSRSYQWGPRPMRRGEDGFWRRKGQEDLLAYELPSDDLTDFLKSISVELKPGKQIAVKVLINQRKHKEKIK